MVVQQRRNALIICTVMVTITVLYLHKQTLLRFVVRAEAPQAVAPIPQQTNPAPQPGQPGSQPLNPAQVPPKEQPPQPNNNAGISPALAKVVTERLSSIYAIKVSNGAGSGFLVRQDLVSTNRHVVSGSSNVRLINFASGKTCSGSLVHEAAGTHDIAFVKLGDDCEKTTPIPIAASSSLDKGSIVFTVGNALNKGLSMSAGKVLDKGVAITTESYQTPNAISHDALIHKGNSGGPLLNTNAEIVGMNTASVRGSYGLAISGEMIQEELSRVR